jgi:hypothetical protein
MYSKAEASQLRQEFWTAFGLYMSPILSADGEKVNWINYKTGEKNIAFRMNAVGKVASIAIEMSHADEGIRQLYFEQFEQLKKVLHSTLEEEWIWLADHTDEYGKTTSRIYTELTGVNIMNKSDWPALIGFFKKRIIALDEFWSNARYGFEALR